MSARSEQFIRTYARLKPLGIFQLSQLSSTRTEVAISRTKDVFEFHEVFNQTSTNRQIFESMMMPIIDNVLEGYNSCILAYGQTASGKTYTMKGEQDELGIIPLTIKEIFERIYRLKLAARVQISYFEIYNQNIIDLLTQSNQTRYLQIRDDAKKNVTIIDLIEQVVQSQHDSIQYFEKGEQKRKFASNNINFNSSRSHTIFKITLDSVNKNMQKIVSHISMVDLAGSQSINKTKAEGVLKKEGQNINKSLLALSNVIRNMSDRNPYINFRDSKLTRILQSSLSNNSKSVIICTVQQTEECLQETVNTLKFGVAAGNIKTFAKKNIIEQKGNELYDQLIQQRQKRRVIQEELEISKLKCRSMAIENKDLLDQNNRLKEYLLQEQNKNLNSQQLINQLKMQNERDLMNKNRFRQETQNTFSYYENQIGQLKENLKQKTALLKRLQEQINLLQRNERSLVDKVNKYERQLANLNKNIKQQELNRQKRKPSIHRLSSIRESQKDESRLNTSKSKRLSLNSDNSYDVDLQSKRIKKQSQQTLCPLTITKIIDLGNSILTMRRQMNEYIKSNAELQQEINNCQERLKKYQQLYGLLEGQEQQKVKKLEISNYKDANPQRQLQHYKRRMGRMKIELSKRKKRQARYLKQLKKAGERRILELDGFNNYIEENHPITEEEHVMLLTSNQDLIPVNYNLDLSTSINESQLE